MNKVIYLARVVKANDGWYAIDFPDLPGTHAQCKDLKSVQKEAEESLCNYLLAAKVVEEEIPAASSTLQLKEDEMAVIISAEWEYCPERLIRC